ncbi:hypothetical protein GCM10023351_03690 [Microbacterium gilvum]|uniref:Uncharacterized protein n=1 Tax=Microbacterium gilvum TaxID=1336204 RepID=A0ABP8ZSN7_9MICO
MEGGDPAEGGDGLLGPRQVGGEHEDAVVRDRREPGGQRRHGTPVRRMLAHPRRGGVCTPAFWPHHDERPAPRRGGERVCEERAAPDLEEGLVGPADACRPPSREDDRGRHDAGG